MLAKRTRMHAVCISIKWHRSGGPPRPKQFRSPSYVCRNRISATNSMYVDLCLILLMFSKQLVVNCNQVIERPIDRRHSLLAPHAMYNCMYANYWRATLRAYNCRWVCVRFFFVLLRVCALLLLLGAWCVHIRQTHTHTSTPTESYSLCAWSSTYTRISVDICSMCLG